MADPVHSEASGAEEASVNGEEASIPEDQPTPAQLVDEAVALQGTDESWAVRLALLETLPEPRHLGPSSEVPLGGTLECPRKVLVVGELLLIANQSATPLLALAKYGHKPVWSQTDTLVSLFTNPSHIPTHS